MDNSLVFGSCGYLGSNFCKFLKSKKKNYTIENFREKTNIEIQNKIKKIEFCNYKNIYWFIGKNSPKESHVDTLKYLEANVVLPSMVLEELIHQGFSGNFNFVSTRLVYDNACLSVREEQASDINLKSPYALAKRYMENQLCLMGVRNNLNAKILRLGVPYGTLNGQVFSNGTIGAFLKQAAAGQITLFGDGSQMRTFTHINDFFEVLYLLRSDITGVDIYNIHGENLTLKEVAEIIAAKMNARVNYVPFPEDAKTLESGNTHFNWLKLQTKLNISPNYKFSEWIKCI